LSGRTLKSDAARERIESAARRVFAEHGYDRATIRAIAALAGTHGSMVIRYFGSKEALFAKSAVFDLRLPDLKSVPVDKRGVVLVGHFIDRWESEDEDLVVLLRAAVSHDEARLRVAEIFEKQLTATLCMLDPIDAPAKAALIASQMLGLAIVRFVLRFESARLLTREKIVARVGATIQTYLEN
jgi:AcrR family transcriptional regulator